MVALLIGNSVRSLNREFVYDLAMQHEADTNTQLF